MKPSESKNGAHHRRFNFPEVQIVQRSHDLDIGSEEGLERIRRLVQRGVNRGLLKRAEPQPSLAVLPRKVRKDYDTRARERISQIYGQEVAS